MSPFLGSPSTGSFNLDFPASKSLNNLFHLFVKEPSKAFCYGSVDGLRQILILHPYKGFGRPCILFPNINFIKGLWSKIIFQIVSDRLFAEGRKIFFLLWHKVCCVCYTILPVISEDWTAGSQIRAHRC